MIACHSEPRILLFFLPFPPRAMRHTDPPSPPSLFFFHKQRLKGTPTLVVTSYRYVIIDVFFSSFFFFSSSANDRREADFLSFLFFSSLSLRYKKDRGISVRSKSFAANASQKSASPLPPNMSKDPTFFPSLSPELNGEASVPRGRTCLCVRFLRLVQRSPPLFFPPPPPDDVNYGRRRSPLPPPPFFFLFLPPSAHAEKKESFQRGVRF